MAINLQKTTQNQIVPPFSETNTIAETHPVCESSMLLSTQRVDCLGPFKFVGPRADAMRRKVYRLYRRCEQFDSMLGSGSTA